MERYLVKIEGLSPLLQHRFTGEDEEVKPGEQRAGFKDYSEEYEAAAYRLEDGTLYQPSSHIEMAMVKAAANFQITGKGKKTYKDLVKAAVTIDPVFIPHIHQDFEVDKRAVRIKTSRVLRQRPRLDKWALEFEITILEPQLPGNILKEILDYAGRYVGIGDYRPKFGRFQVVKWEKVEEVKAA